MTDPIADMLTRIRNALAVHKTEVVMPHSRLKEAVARLFCDGRWVRAVEVINQKPQCLLRITLEYTSAGEPAIRRLDRISTPGRRHYVAKDAIPMVLNNMGIAVLSTSKGLMTNRQARRLGVGGEVLCEIA